MTARKKKAAPKAPALPPDVTPADLEYPKAPAFGTPEYKRYAEVAYGDHGGRLTFHRVTKVGWVLATLPIAAARRGSGLADRTYAYGVEDRKVYTVGKGPHVEATVVVHLGHLNRDRLQKYLDLWEEGLAAAGTIRDRISSRRAQGQLRRAAGETSWLW